MENHREIAWGRAWRFAAAAAVLGVAACSTTVDKKDLDLPEQADQAQKFPYKYGWRLKTKTEARDAVYREAPSLPYGHVYTQINVSQLPIGAATSAEQGDGGVSSIACGENKGSIGGFLRILGIRREGVAAITVQVFSGDQSLSPEVPVFTVTKVGQDCQYYVYDGSLTQLISQSAVDSVRLKYKIRHTKTNRSNFAPILGLASSIATAASQNATDGIAGALADIATHGIQDKVNQFLSAIGNQQTALEFDQEVPLRPGSYRSDRLIISTAEPIIKNAWGVDFSPQHNNAVAFQIDVAYRHSLFATCDTYGLIDLEDGRHKCTFDSPTTILTQRKFNRETYGEVAAKAGSGAGGLLKDLESAAALAPDASSANPVLARRNAILAVCTKLRNGAEFKPASQLNHLDQALLRYAMVAQYTDYENDPRLRSEECLSRSERENFLSLSAVNYPLNERIDDAGAIRARAYDNIRWVEEKLAGPDGKRALFGQNGEVHVRLAPLALKADGSELRAASATGPAAAQLIDDVKFRNSAFCRRPGFSQDGVNETSSVVGFWHIVADKAAGGVWSRRDASLDASDPYLNGTIAVPLVATLSETDGAVSLVSLAFASSPTEFYQRLNLPVPAQPWQACPDATEPQKKAADRLKALLGEN